MLQKKSDRTYLNGHSISIVCILVCKGGIELDKNSLYRKCFVLVIAFLFLGTSVLSFTASSVKQKGLMDATPSIEIPSNIVSQPVNQKRLLDPEPWWDSNWMYRKKITIDHSKVSGDLQNFPVLIDNISSNFTLHAQPDGDDFVFVDASNSIKYNHEIESYNPTTGEFVAWVNVTLLSSTSDTILYLYYGNPTCSNQQNVHGTWDSDYIGVWHLNDATTSTVTDSTVNGYTGTKKAANEPIETTGKIGRAQSFDNYDDRINIGDINQNQLTISAWVKCGYTSEDEMIVNKGYTSHTYPYYEYDLCLEYPGAVPPVKGKANGGLIVDGVGYFTRATSGDLKDSTWHYVFLRYDGETLGVGSDGDNEGTDGSMLGNISDYATNAYIGGYTNIGTLGFNGLIDEVRISNIARSTAWISTEYNNQNDPISFMTFGDEQSFSSPTTIYVHPGESIQAAINIANPGDTVFVFNGTYYENVIVDKTVNLIGEDKNNTIIDGGGSGDVVYISANDVSISGFTIQNSSSFDYTEGAGIDIKSDHNTIRNCIIKSNQGLGIWIHYSTSNTFTDNTLINNGFVIWGYALEHWNTHSIDVSNTVNEKPVYYWKDQTSGTVPLGAGQMILANCTNVIVQNQNVSDGTEGISLGFSSNCTVVNNIASNNNQIGINLSNSYNNIIANNTVISNNIYGINFIASKNNIVNSNTVLHNEIGIVYWDKMSEFNTIYNNYFNNTNNAFFRYANNIWNISKTPGTNIIGGPYLGGNYWSDYTGEDLDGDGLGDTNVPYGPGDYLPLTTPSNQLPIANFTYTPENPSNIVFIHFTDTSTDPDGTIVSWSWDFGDGINSTEQNPTHRYIHGGTYTVTLTVTDNNGAQDTILSSVEVSTVNYQPNTPDIPAGPIRGIAGVDYIYTTQTSDPNGNFIKYGWDWDGDLIVDTWTTFIQSGVEISTHHIWSEHGMYTIRVKANDTYGLESDWSEPFQIKMYKLGDVNGDGMVTFADIDPFVAAIGTTEAQFQAQHPTWSWLAADCNQDGHITFADIDPFVALIGTKK